jgi:hypothetical protein
MSRQISSRARLSHKELIRVSQKPDQKLKLMVQQLGWPNCRNGVREESMLLHFVDLKSDGIFLVTLSKKEMSIEILGSG